MISNPELNASLNGASAVFLGVGYIMIRRKRILAHKVCMLAAVTCSAVFLVSYVVYHLHAGIIRFAGQGFIRPVYFTMLTSHTILAVAIVPLVIITLTRALRSNFAAHKRIARWTFPIWAYVSVTGVLIYILLYHLYAPRGV